MVGRREGVKDGKGVFVTRGASVAGVLVGPAVLMAKRSGVFVEINVTVGRGELTISGAGVGDCRNDKFCKAEHPVRINASMARTIFFMNSSSMIYLSFSQLYPH